MITLGQEKAVYSILLPEIREVLIESIATCYVHTANNMMLNKLRKDIELKYRNWVKDIVDLSEFPFAYPINGATHGIDQWLLTNSNVPIQQGIGEYGWAKIQRPDIEITDTPTTKAYVSNPFSATGNYEDRHIKYNVPVLLDCAFVGSVMKKRIVITPNVEAITFSMSKGFSANLLRSGFMFSRTEIKGLQILMSYNYFNVASIKTLDAIISNFPVDYVYNKLKPTQELICSENNFIPSDCVFLASTKDPAYDHWKRGDGTNRLCLSREYVKRGIGSFDL